MYLCIRVSLPSLYQARKVNGHVFVCRPGKSVVMYLCIRVSLPSLYQARKVSGHVFVC